MFTSCTTYKTVNKTFENSTAFRQGFSGLVVYDPETNKTLYEHNAEKYFTPASNIKLFSLYTGLKILGDSVPALEYFYNNDTLVFSGTGDPSLLNPDLPDSRVLHFLKNIKAPLAYIPPVTEEKIFGPGWAWDDYNSYYSVERTPLPIYGNRVSFQQKQGSEAMKVYPASFKDSLFTETPAGASQSGIKRDQGKNRFVFYPYQKPGFLNQDVPFKFSSELLVKLLSDTLQKEVRIFTGAVPASAEKNTVYSIHVDSMYKRMMEVSDNFIAEQILLLASKTISDTLNAGIAIRHMKENFLRDLPDEAYWVDGSGLSRYNLVTPRSMIKLLSKIEKEVPRERLFNMLATGGKSGTLKNSYIAEPPYIFAKTGTLRNNHSLSGFLRAKSGKILIFSFMNSNYTVPTSEIKTQMELILRNFYEVN
ncbi:D-alanyl-D-alanine carboxypeptidase [Antarcticibacterium arcticum]|uniref:D-alanyl-D-alanine carboxypeptidase n=2 Tax=Antarcticibacterium arcticum TaxID=2585771 RepID=A0A5B8YQE8_9FLAO|nr:D-alanyl-D-alanine carboxypeptidase [Antarcticibacterium arcticum]